MKDPADHTEHKKNKAQIECPRFLHQTTLARPLFPLNRSHAGDGVLRGNATARLFVVMLPRQNSCDRLQHAVSAGDTSQKPIL
jgi:hypothetical protein